MGRSYYKQEDQEQRKLDWFRVIDEEIRNRESRWNPGSCELPDLLFPKGYHPGKVFADKSFEQGIAEGSGIAKSADGWYREPLSKEETEEEYHVRQNSALKSFVEDKLYVVKDSQKIKLVTIPPMVNFMADVFFRRVSKVILWKPRGGGGSLSAAVLIYLLMVYRKLSVIDVAGSQEQSKVVYNYVKGFWDCNSVLRDSLMDGLPLSGMTRLKTGAVLHCIPATDKQVRGKHVSTVVVDEACQNDASGDDAFRACLQGVSSEKDPIVILLSTFHIPIGLFQEVWDNAEEKGFKKYSWNCFDTLSRCIRGIESSTPADPLALSHCEKCFLTYSKKIVDDKGDEIHSEWGGCYGQARNSSGWATYESLVEARKLNIGTRIFENEFANERPSYQGMVYDPDLIDEALVEPIAFDKLKEGALEVAVGIDWGLETANSQCTTLGIRYADHVYVAEAVYQDHKLPSDLVPFLQQWQGLCKDFNVFCDGSHPYNNMELEKYGFRVHRVHFGTLKFPGVNNIVRFLTYRRIKINRALEMLIRQLKKYRRSSTTGSFVKGDDHGPDSALCLMLRWRYEETYGDLGKARIGRQEMISVARAEDRVKFIRDGTHVAMVPNDLKPLLDSVRNKTAVEELAKRSVMIF